MTVSKTHVLSEKVSRLLNPYEKFRLIEDAPGVPGYLFDLTTSIYIHRKHTRRDLFIPHSVYQASMCTALPSKEFLVEWLKHAREAAIKLINKGEYYDYDKHDNRLKRKYNQWIYWDKTNHRLVGKVQALDSHSSEQHRANTEPNVSKLKRGSETGTK